MQISEIVSGIITGVTVGFILYLINSSNIRKQRNYDNEKKDFECLSKNVILDQILNKSQYNYQIATLEYIVKEYNKKENTFNIPMLLEDSSLDDIPLISPWSWYFKGILKQNFEDDSVLIIDVDWIINRDKEMKLELVNIKKEFKKILNNLDSPKYKKKLKKIIYVLEYIINESDEAYLYGNEELPEYQILKAEENMEKERCIISYESIPYLLFEPRNLSEYAYSSTSELSEIIEKSNSEEIEDKYSNLIERRQHDINTLYFDPIIVSSDAIDYTKWFKYSLIHTRINSYSEKLILQRRGSKKIYYRICNITNNNKFLTLFCD